MFVNGINQTNHSTKFMASQYVHTYWLEDDDDIYYDDEDTTTTFGNNNNNIDTAAARSSPNCN